MATSSHNSRGNAPVRSGMRNPYESDSRSVPYANKKSQPSPFGLGSAMSDLAGIGDGILDTLLSSSKSESRSYPKPMQRGDAPPLYSTPAKNNSESLDFPGNIPSPFPNAAESEEFFDPFTFTGEKDETAQNAQFAANRKAEFEAESKKRSSQEMAQIAQLEESIRKEIASLQKANHEMIAKTRELQKLSLNEKRNKKGVGYIRNLEIRKMLLQTLYQDVSKSNIWLEAMISKKKKRGSLFAKAQKDNNQLLTLSQESVVSRSTG